MTIVLAKYLVQQNLVSAEAMDDLLQRQSDSGGSLDTNILEEGLLAEAPLTKALSEVYRLPAATPELLESHDQRMPNMFPARLAQKYQVAPVAMSGRTLLLLAATRLHPLVEEEIGFMLSVSVKTSLVCEARLRLLQRDWMGLEIEPRYAMLAERLGKYQFVAGVESAEPEATAAKKQPLEEHPSEEHPPEEQIPEEHPPENILPDKISFEEATRICLRAGSRDDIVDITLRFAHQFLSYVGLFVINNDQILGWNAIGFPDSRERIRRVRLPVNSPSVLRTIMQTRAHFLGPMPSSGINDELLRIMGRDNPRNVLIAPILLQDHLLGMFFGDDGERSIQSGHLTELLVFINGLASAFEQVIHKRKSRVPTPSLLEPEQAHSGAESPPAPAEASTVEAASQRGEEALTSEHSTEPLIVAYPEGAFEDSVAADDGFIDEQQSPAFAAEEVAVLSTTGIVQPEFGEEALQNLMPTEVQKSDEATPLNVDMPENEAAVIVVNNSAELDAFQPSSAEFPVTEAEDLSALDETPPRNLPREAPMLDLHAPSSVSAPVEKRAVASEPSSEQEAVPPTQEPRAAAQADDSGLISALADELVCGDQMRMERAREKLIRIGLAAVPAIMERFPGHLTFEVRGNHDHIPPVSEHSELLRCLVEIGPAAAEAVAKRLNDPKRRVRYYAVKLLGEVSYPAAVSQLAQRLFDREALVRLATLEVLAGYRRTPMFDAILIGLRSRLEQQNPDQQAIAAALLGNFKDRRSVPILIKLVKSPHKMVQHAAIESLSYITKQEFAARQGAWLKWWRLHSGEHRVQWLIEGLRSKNSDIRFSACQELFQITGEYFGYYYDSEKKERQRAVLRWEEWWIEKGRHLNLDD